MATPTVRERLSGFDNGNTGGVDITVTTGAGTQVGDLLVCFHSTDYYLASAMTTPTGTAGTWSLRATGDSGTNIGHVKVWTRGVTTAGAQTVTVPKNGDAANYQVLYVIAGADSTAPVDAATGANGTGTSAAAPALTIPSGHTDDLLLVGYLASGTFATSNFTTPTGISNFTEIDNTFSTAADGRQVLTASGSTGTRSSTISPSTAGLAWAAVSIALWGGLGVIPHDLTDSGPTTETAAVAKTETRSLTDSPPTTDTATVFVGWPAIGEAAPTAETLTLQQLDQRSTSDSATTAEVINVATFIGKAATDDAPTTEAIGVVQTNFVSLTDSAPTTESTNLLQIWQLTDSGPGSDTVLGLGGSILTENAPTAEDLQVTVIPFTQVLPLRDLVVYDLVVVARIPQAGGPPAFIEIDPVEWKSLTYSNELSQPQALTATCQISSVTEEILQRLRRLHELATELWLFREGVLIFAGPLQGFQTSGETLTLKAQGLLAYLRLMVIQQDLKFANVDQFTMVKSMVDQWQSLPYGNFGIDTSTVSLSGVTRTQDYLRDELHIVGSKVEELGKAAQGFDVEVNPATRKLELWYPAKGTDRSTGEDAIVLDSRNISSGDIVCSVAPGDLASESYGTAKGPGQDTTLFSVQSNVELRARYGRTAVTSTYSDVSTQADLDDFVEGVRDARGVALLLPGPKVRVTPDADLSEYGVGDVIAYDLGGELGIFDTFRIRKATVNASPTGQETVDLEFV